MTVTKLSKSAIKYLTPENLYKQIGDFTSGMAVTKGSYESVVTKCNLSDIEWNHMDQLHRRYIHNTYEKGIRIALGENFAISLTQWKKWPFFITVTDVYVARGLFYQSLTIAGMLFLHCIISMEEQGENIKLIDEWYIASHRLFKFLHKPLSKKLYKLNHRLQQEDQQIRQSRYELRQQGYEFSSDPPNYYSSNKLTPNTIYPKLTSELLININELSNEKKQIKVGNVDFLVQKASDKYLIWPAVCPHEGGPLKNGSFCNDKVTCPWHGLQFVAAQLSDEKITDQRYGFEYRLCDGSILVSQVNTSFMQQANKKVL